MLRLFSKRGTNVPLSRSSFWEGVSTVRRINPSRSSHAFGSAEATDEKIALKDTVLLGLSGSGGVAEQVGGRNVLRRDDGNAGSVDGDTNANGKYRCSVVAMMVMMPFSVLSLTPFSLSLTLRGG